MPKLINTKIKNENSELEAHKPKKDGIEIEKGAILTEEYLKRNKNQIEDMMCYFTAYPDLFLDLITPENENINLFFYQRIVLRAIMRFKRVYVVACRAFSKSFITILALVLQCIFMPGTKRFICAPGKGQSAQIAKEKLAEIFRYWPLLRKEVVGGDISDMPGNYGKDYVTLKFRNGSQFDVVAALDSQRGGRRNGGLIDEIRDHDETAINEIVLPLMNVSRRLPDNTVNEKEPNQQRICMTSAGSKISFSYDMLIDMFETSIINPEGAFVMGVDYRVPVLHGLLDRAYINELKMSPSYNEESFAREYMSIWSGASDESWFNFDKMQKYRKIKNPEFHAKNKLQSNEFYLLSVDVGRLNDQTVVCVFRINILKGKYYSTLVNLIVLGRTTETKPFSVQVTDLKRLIKLYNPREVVIDTNGLGIGFSDEIVKEHIDPETGEVFPSYGFFNETMKDYFKTQPKDAIKILYGIKASGPLNSKIHSNAFSRISGGMVRFLIKEQEAKSALLSTKIGQKMSTEERVKRLMPHEMTTRLFEEMANLKLKQTGVGLDIVLEQINTHFPKDKYSAFAYGLWRINELEQEQMKKNRRRSAYSGRQLVFFSGGI